MGVGSSPYNCAQSQICSFQALAKLLQDDILNTLVILYLGKYGCTCFSNHLLPCYCGQ